MAAECIYTFLVMGVLPLCEAYVCTVSNESHWTTTNIYLAAKWRRLTSGSLSAIKFRLENKSNHLNLPRNMNIMTILLERHALFSRRKRKQESADNFISNCFTFYQDNFPKHIVVQLPKGNNNNWNSATQPKVSFRLER